MFAIIAAVILISLIGAGLAAILVVSERFISDYGQCEVDINGGERKLMVKGGNNLLSALAAEKLFIPSACGGKGTCGYCKVKVLDGGGAVGPTEEPFLSEAEKKEQVRLSCQVKIRSNINIAIPRELFSIREYKCVCAEITDLTYDTKQFRLELKEPDVMDYTPGQYVQLLTPAYKGSPEEVYRAYSMSSDPTDKHFIELVIRRVPNGICTTYCFDYLKKGDTVMVNGPYGEFTLRETDAPIVFVAGGSGMAPIKCMLHHMKNTGCAREAVYFFGANTEKDLFYVDLVRKFETELANFKFIPSVARPVDNSGWAGEVGLVTESVKRNLTDAGKKEGYLCGSPGMIDAVVKVLVGLGMREDKIYYDKFA